MKQPCPSCGKRVDFAKNDRVCPYCGAVYAHSTAEILSSAHQVDTTNVPPDTIQDEVQPADVPRKATRRTPKKRSPIKILLTNLMFLGVAVWGVVRLLRLAGVEMPEIRDSRGDVSWHDDSVRESPLQEFEVSVEYPEISIPDPIENVELACGEVYALDAGTLIIHDARNATELEGFSADIAPDPGRQLVSVSYTYTGTEGGPGTAALCMPDGAGQFSMLPATLAGYDTALEETLIDLGITKAIAPGEGWLVFSVPAEVEIGDMTLQLIGTTGEGKVRIIEVSFSTQ